VELLHLLHQRYYHDQWVTYIDLLSHRAGAVDVEFLHLHQTSTLLS
jgi:hypothetical protein